MFEKSCRFSTGEANVNPRAARADRVVEAFIFGSGNNSCLVEKQIRMI